jgi:chromosome partitioning protein
MKKIVITSQKGGSGKTTVTAHISVECERCGDGPACVIDTDKQATLTRWHERREQDTPQRVDLPFSRLAQGMEALAGHGMSYCFVDTAPTISEQSAVLLELADLVLIPVRPSPADLWSVSETVDLVKKAAKPFLFVISQAKAQASITAQAIAALSQHGRVAQSFIGDRVPYAVAMTGGRTAPELSAKGPAAEEISSLWAEVKSCFHEKMKSERKIVNG